MFTIAASLNTLPLEQHGRNSLDSEGLAGIVATMPQLQDLAAALNRTEKNRCGAAVYGVEQPIVQSLGLRRMETGSMRRRIE